MWSKSSFELKTNPLKHQYKKKPRINKNNCLLPSVSSVCDTQGKQLVWRLLHRPAPRDTGCAEVWLRVVPESWRPGGIHGRPGTMERSRQGAHGEGQGVLLRRKEKQALQNVLSLSPNNLYFTVNCIINSNTDIFTRCFHIYINK